MACVEIHQFGGGFVLPFRVTQSRFQQWRQLVGNEFGVEYFPQICRRSATQQIDCRGADIFFFRPCLWLEGHDRTLDEIELARNILARLFVTHHHSILHPVKVAHHVWEFDGVYAVTEYHNAGRNKRAQ
ncbi:hypothetical protein LG047_04850 [Methylocystis sp. WRRC1]|uniref:hypothetical protein n=1 Tax=Methylocystis sp. WRRC1 TaxID=1732014 RepID=UPI001D14ACED|nr:hypothetical protein [Methylocystis sp. WRRC1]MCC3244653.1 hypothetical protein [Methylocystis sp. WRRC1]